MYQSSRFLRAELDELCAGQAEVIRGEIRQLVALVNLAERYRVDEAELVDALLDGRPRGGSDGTPNISEFLSLEVGAALGIPVPQAAARIHAALDLKYRHPALWREVLDGHVRVWQAAKVTSRVASSGLGLAAVAEVDEAFVAQTRGLSFGRAMKILDALIIDADAELAAQRVALASEVRRVMFDRQHDGVIGMFALLDASDACLLKATTAQLADTLARAGDTDPASIRHAKALGILANPARALRLLSDDLETQPVDLDALLPQATLIVHLSPGTIVDDAGVARVEGIGPLDVTALRQFLATTRVSVRPVVDLNAIVAVDRYEVPDQIRRAVTNRHPYERFPYSTLPASRCDLDHTVPWRPTNGPEQTGPANLAPLSRRVHRAKTAGHWIMHQTDPDSYAWESPLGYRYIEGPDGTRRLTPHNQAA